MKNLLSLTICLIAISYFAAFAHFPVSNQSPHFIVTSGEAKSVEKFALLSTKVNVSIAGTVADATIEQIYVNRGDFPIEAVYVFPASTRAAVYGMTMYIGSREIVAVCKRKETARKEYETAKKEGKRASLLEQFKPNVFQMNVANIMPGDTIKTVMKYVENISAEAGEYEFVYPCVVGPRYTGSGLKENDQFVHNADQSAKDAIAGSKFDITVNLLAGMKIMQIYSESHKVNVENGSNPDAINTSAKITLDESAKIPNKDFILKYSLEDFKIQTGLIINKNQKENFFSLTLEPPSRVEAKDIPAREYIFILDVSGSMDGFPLETSKKTILKIIDGLRAEDKFNVVFFAGGSESMFCESVNANDFVKKIAHRKIDAYHNGGGTELMNALKQAFAIKKAEGYSRTIAILTDGFVTVEEEAFDFIKNNLDGANFFSLGIGGSVNRFLIEGMARIGLGEPFIVETKENADEIAEKFLTYIQNPIMTDIKVEFEGIMAQDIVPEKIPDLFADRPITVFGKYEGQAGGKFKVSGMYKGEKLQVEIPVLKFGEFDESQALKYLWVRSKIAELDDYSGLVRNGSPKAKKIEEEVTVLGEKYNLLTKYTSFIAVDEVVANKPSDDDDINPMAPTQKSAPARAAKSKSGKVDATAVGSVKSLGGDEMNAAARESLNQVIGMSAGVTNGGDGFTIRNQNPSGLANVELIDRASAAGGTGQDNGMFSSNVEFTTNAITQRVAVIEYSPEPDINEFKSFEKDPVVDMKQILGNVVYPEMAKRANIEGKVVVKVLIGKSGKVEKYQIASSDNDMLNKAALDAIKKCGRIQPAIQNGVPVSCWINVPIVFGLKNSKINTTDNIQKSVEFLTNSGVQNINSTIPPKFEKKELSNNIVFPEGAFRSFESHIELDVLISSMGAIENVKIDSSTNDMFNKMALDAVKKTRFTAAQLDGKNVSYNLKICIESDKNKNIKIIDLSKKNYDNRKQIGLVNKIMEIQNYFESNFKYTDFINEFKKFPPKGIKLNIRFNANGVFDSGYLQKQLDSDLLPYFNSMLSNPNINLDIYPNLISNEEFSDTLNLNFYKTYGSLDSVNVRWLTVNNDYNNLKANTLRKGELVRFNVSFYRGKCLILIPSKILNFKFREEAEFRYLEDRLIRFNTMNITNERIKYNPKYMSHLFPELKGMENEDIELEIMAEKPE